MPGVVYLCDGLKDEEMKRLRTGHEFDSFRKLLVKLDPVNLAPEIFGKAEDFRPHIGEYAWGLFATYHTIVIRVIFVLSDANKDPRWYCDREIGALIVSAFGQEKFKSMLELPYRRFEWLRRAFEVSLLESFDNVLSGKEFSEAALEQAQRMERELSRATTTSTIEALHS